MKMNEKMKKTVLSMIGFLAGAWILCAVIVPSVYQMRAMLAVTILWAAVLCFRITKAEDSQPKQRTMQVIDLEPDYKALFLQQMQYRVQDKLRSKFPGATVELGEKEIERIAKMGTAVYVPIKKADDYCHMSISMNQNGDFRLNLFSLVNLDQVQNNVLKDLEEADHEKAVEQWYSQKGQELLNELITSMNSRGHREFTITESGDVMVKENGRSVKKDRFKEIPPKVQWERLKELMTEDELNVQVSARRLTIAW